MAFHPDANADLVETAEEVSSSFAPALNLAPRFSHSQIFFARRERDFSAGLSLPPLPAPVAAPAPAPAPIPAAVLPPRPETALPAFAAATPATPLNSIAASTTVPPLPTPVSVPAKRGASAWLDDDEMDESAAVEPAPKKISLDEWRLQQREKEGGACSVHEDARSSSSRTGRRSKRGEKRERETSPRGSESSAGRRKTEGAQNWLDDLPKGSRNGFARESRREERDGRRDTRDLRKDERDGRRDIRDEGYGSRERRPSGSGYGHRDDERRGCEDGGRRVEDRRDDLSGARREGWSRLPQEDRLATGLSLYTTRAAPPTGPSNPRAHLSLPPPAPPREQDVPAEIVQTLKIVFIRQIPENNNVGDVLRLLQSFHRVAPVGVKIVRNGVAPSIRTGARVVNAYAAYEYAEDAQTVKCCLDGFVLGGENLQAVDGFPPLSLDGTPKLTGEQACSLPCRFHDLLRLFSGHMSVEMDPHNAQLPPSLPSSPARPVLLATAAASYLDRASHFCSSATVVSISVLPRSNLAPPDPASRSFAVARPSTLLITTASSARTTFLEASPTACTSSTPRDSPSTSRSKSFEILSTIWTVRLLLQMPSLLT